MERTDAIAEHSARLPAAGALLELLKPVTWFPPMWAFLCGAVSANAAWRSDTLLIAAGVVLTGPLVCGASQIINDWCDREVDAINEPHRPFPSGRVSVAAGLVFALGWSGLALLWGIALGPTVAAATLLGLVLAWAYSAPPLRLKRNGWWGNAAVGISYEGLAWVTGAAVIMGGAMPPPAIILVAALYSIGAHGIMTLNDFKSIDGDRELGLRSLPAALGADRAAKLACVVMLVPQLVVVGLLMVSQHHWHALSVGILVLLQIAAMLRLLRDPLGLAPWYNATGVSAYVTGMMVTATALPSLTLL